MRQFLFDNVIVKNVNMVPMNLLFPKGIIDEMEQLGICMGGCYWNSIKVAKFLESKGYKIDVVEGFYKIKNNARKRLHDTEIPKWKEHRWCKMGNHYFDATVYLGSRCYKCKDFYYRAERLYNADDLLEFSEMVAKETPIQSDCIEGIDEHLWCSSITGRTFVPDIEKYIYLAKIDRDYHFVKCA